MMAKVVVVVVVLCGRGFCNFVSKWIASLKSSVSVCFVRKAYMELSLKACESIQCPLSFQSFQNSINPKTKVEPGMYVNSTTANPRKRKYLYLVLVCTYILSTRSTLRSLPYRFAMYEYIVSLKAFRVHSYLSHFSRFKIWLISRFKIR